MVQFHNAVQRRDPICTPYVLRGEYLQIVGQFFADVGTFKPYSFETAQYIAKILNKRPENRPYVHHGIFVQDIGLLDPGAVAAGNDALLQLLGSRKIAKIAELCLLFPASFIGTSPNFHGCVAWNFTKCSPLFSN